MTVLPLMTVSGIRGIVDETLTEHFCERFARTHADVFKARTVAIGRDTRPSGSRLVNACTRGFHAAGARVIDLGVCPTPTVCVATPLTGADIGVILTASHNPAPYNGYKMVHASGRLCNGSECQRVYEQFLEDAGSALAGGIGTADSTFDPLPAHIDAICRQIDEPAIRAAGLFIAIDAINGAAAVIVPALLHRLGVRWTGVHTDPSGNFAHDPEPRPEHLKELSSLAAKSEGLWGGFAFDPDADRLAPMGERGEALSEEFTLALALDALFPRTGGPAAVNLSTSMLVDDVARAHKTSIVRSCIGEANVVAAMQASGCPVGGEGNGGVIYPAISTVRDGPAALAVILGHMAASGKRLTQLTSMWPSYSIIKIKIPLRDIHSSQVMVALRSRFSNERTDTLDGLKIVRDYGWVHLRASNTEPILRCYAEAATRQQAQELATMITGHLETIVPPGSV